MKSENLISPAYLALLSQKHELDATWGTSGEHHADTVLGLIIENGYTSVLDYGCGKGTLVNTINDALGDVRLEGGIKGYDPAVRGFDTEPQPAQLVTCTDVMEHIEEEHLSSVLAHICQLADKAAFFVIHTGLASHTLPDGRNAHITVKPAEWWCERIAEFFCIDEIHPLDNELFTVTARPWTAEVIEEIRSRVVDTPIDPQPKPKPNNIGAGFCGF